MTVRELIYRLESEYWYDAKVYVRDKEGGYVEATYTHKWFYLSYPKPGEERERRVVIEG